jgi:hypothetical protein
MTAFWIDMFHPRVGLIWPFLIVADNIEDAEETAKIHIWWKTGDKTWITDDWRVV